MSTFKQYVISFPATMPYFEHEDDLVTIRQASLYDYRKKPDTREDFIKCSDYLSKNTFESLLPGIDAGDGEKVLNIALRYWSGCSVERSVDRALYFLEMIASEIHERRLPESSLTPSLLARAYSCLAYIHYELHEYACNGTVVPREPIGSRYRHGLPLPSSETPDYDAAHTFLYISATYADASAALGLVSSAVLSSARLLLRLAERDGKAVREGARYSKLRNLWRVADERTREVQEQERKSAAKMAKAPNAYVCAGPGCGLGATKKKGLMRCGGTCPAARKPHYCSKECQKRDWELHKALCKPDEELNAGGPVPTAPAIDSAAVSLDKADSSCATWDTEIPSGYEGPERTIDVELPGHPEKMRIVSRNLPPEVMRWMRDTVTAETESAMRIGSN